MVDSPEPAATSQAPGSITRRFVSRGEMAARARTETLQVADLAALELRPGNYIYEHQGQPLHYAFYLKFTDPGQPLLVFGQGFQARSQVQLPRFQRMDWAEELPYNALIFNDPTLFLREDVSLGWCAGTAEAPVLPTHCEIVGQVRDALGIRNENILFYGSSAGGFTSLMMASRMPGSSALVNNPQTDVLKFRRGGVRRLLEVGFGGIPLDRAKAEFPDRFSFVASIAAGAQVPRIYYLQNILDDDHYTDQLLPLLGTLKLRAEERQEIDLSQRFILELYSDAKALHNPVGFDKIRSCLESIRPWFEGAPVQD
ncbi:hypothetical protein [Falsiroseomonas tokyonensis]|uniref:Uncharacterized protein n=1 Tax=Falsiroseomonas tokyonensis TaxID=430521 RepID=A0ABV7BQS8_9PROT|nr:hypothetical protein [Falsiroseomonas tokyonensis]MBU8536416.1 hypothetical protein [Falsiroseomonas tokyonensis]